MTATDWTEFTARRPFLTPRARRGTMEPATRLRKSPISAMLAVVGGSVRPPFEAVVPLPTRATVQGAPIVESAAIASGKFKENCAA
jgi:hypothetical protein